MAVMTPRESWTDEPKLREELGEMRAEIRGLEKTLDAKFETVDAKFEAVDARFDAVDAKFEAVIRTLQIGFGLIGAVLTGILGLIAAQL